MKKNTSLVEILECAGYGAYFRLRDVKSLGVSYCELTKYIANGEVEKVGSGLYHLSSIESDEFDTVAMVSSIVRDGIICLLTALRIHDIGTQSPHEVWLAIGRKARKPARLPTQVRIVRFSGAMLTYGVSIRSMMGIPVKITSPARTIVDCFRYRKIVGIDVALEALRDGIRRKKTTIEEITRAAEVCKARTIVRPYLEMLST